LSEYIGIALIVFIAVPAPLFIILYFITEWKRSREISGGDERMLEDLWRLSQRLEERLESLETILDSEMPEWRRK
jgi:phage shock protein B